MNLPTLFVVIPLAAAALFLYHRRQMMALRGARAASDGWRKVASYQHKNLQACPHCGALCADWRDIERHTDPRFSACAAHIQAREDAERREHLEEPVNNWTAILEPAGVHDDDQ